MQATPALFEAYSAVLPVPAFPAPLPFPIVQESRAYAESLEEIQSIGRDLGGNTVVAHVEELPEEEPDSFFDDDPDDPMVRVPVVEQIRRQNPILSSLEAIGQTEDRFRGLSIEDETNQARSERYQRYVSTRPGEIPIGRKKHREMINPSNVCGWWLEIFMFVLVVGLFGAGSPIAALIYLLLRNIKPVIKIIVRIWLDAGFVTFFPILSVFIEKPKQTEFERQMQEWHETGTVTQRDFRDHPVYKQKIEAVRKQGGRWLYNHKQDDRVYQEWNMSTNGWNPVDGFGRKWFPDENDWTRLALP